jgi:sarcosine oxidase
MSTYDVAVIGLGAAGAATLRALAKTRAKVIGIDQFKPPHARGSSHGETRLLRTAYAEGEFYVPLVRRAISLWRELEEATGKRLFEQTGVTYAGPAGDAFMLDSRRAARKWKLALPMSEPLDSWFRLPGEWQALVDSAGGYLYPERAISAFLAEAQNCGAVIRTGARCEMIDGSKRTVRLRTSTGHFDAKRVVVTTGAWSTELLPALKPITHVERRVLHWFDDPKRRFTRASGFRPFAISTGEDQLFYGFPANRRGEVKAAEHWTLEVVSGPSEVKRTIRKADLAAIRPLVRTYMPGLGKHVRSEVCMYPMAADEHFILDRDPRDSRIIIGAGLSGHGFKFAPAIGEVLAHLALGKRQKVDIKPFALAGRLT